MPKMNGYELAKQIRAIRQDIPIILCTGFVDKDDEKNREDAHINGFILKPINNLNLAETIRRVLDKEADKLISC